MPRQVLDISRLVDEQRIGAFTIRLVLFSFALMLTDGYDLLAASYGAPSLIAAWHVAPSSLGPMFSASPVGMVVGAPLLGWVGDRFGRRNTVILGTAIYGVFTLACAATQSLEQLMALRFLTGVGLGGMLPNITALNAEFAPKRMRATLIVLMFAGVTAGSTLPGLVVAVIPGVDWRSLYIIGGVVPLVFAAALAFWLPESIKFLMLKEGGNARSRIRQTVRQLRPDLAIGEDVDFVSGETRANGAPIAALFQDGLHWITPLLWILFVANLTANYFLYSWMPVLFHAAGFTASQAALTTACYYVGGVSGGLLISWLLDRKGLIAIAAFFAAGCVSVACIGLPGLQTFAVIIFVFLSGMCVLGVQLGLNAASGLIYPTRIRATGAGWSFGIGRLGGIFGPMLGAWLIGLKLPTMQLFFAPAVPLGIGAVTCYILMRLCRSRFGGDQLDEAAKQSPPSAAGVQAR